VLVTQAQPDAPAAQAGILAGDIITAINGTAIPDSTTLADMLAGSKPGQSVSVILTHPDGTTQTVQVSLGTYQA
jgi:serine protease Do